MRPDQLTAWDHLVASAAVLSALANIVTFTGIVAALPEHTARLIIAAHLYSLTALIWAHRWRPTSR